MPTPRTRATHLGPERRRPQVLDAALAIAMEQGVGALTLGAVAERLEVTRPVVYSCFADRVELIDALLDREAKALLDGVLDVLHSVRGTEPEAVFVGGYQALLKAVAQQPLSWRLVFSPNADPAVADRFARARLVVADKTTRWMRPVLGPWWGIEDADRKLPALIELFMSSCEAAMRVLLSPSNTWSAEALGELFGRAMFRAFSGV